MGHRAQQNSAVTAARIISVRIRTRGMAVVFHLGSGGSDETGSHGWLAAYWYFRLSARW